MQMPRISAWASRPGRPASSDRLVTAVAAAVCLLVAAYLGLHQRDAASVRIANEHGLNGRYAEAIAEARQVTRAPAETRALTVRAHAAQALGRHRDAVDVFRRVAEREPRSWHIHRDWAISLQALGRNRAARERLEVAAALNPRMPALP